MSRSFVPAAAAIAIAAAGCGSSSSSKTTGATPSAPATPSTSTSTGSRITPSTPITDPRFRALLRSSIITNGHTPPSKAPAIEQCVIQGLPAQGIKTAGDFIRKRSAAAAAVNTCAKKLGVK